MSMIEKFLGAKDKLRSDLIDIKDEMLKAAEAKANQRIDGFIDEAKAMIAEATDAEFVEFITSGKLEDDDVNAALMFRAMARKEKNAKVEDEPHSWPNAKREAPVHVIVVGEI